VDPANLTDVKIRLLPGQHIAHLRLLHQEHRATDDRSESGRGHGHVRADLNNQMPQAVSGINGYAVQSAPFPQNGNAMTMQVKATSGALVSRTRPAEVSRPRTMAPDPSRRHQRLGAGSRRDPFYDPTRAASRSVTHVGEEHLVVHDGLDRRRGL